MPRAFRQSQHFGVCKYLLHLCFLLSRDGIILLRVLTVLLLPLPFHLVLGRPQRPQRLQQPCGGRRGRLQLPPCAFLLHQHPRFTLRPSAAFLFQRLVMFQQGGVGGDALGLLVCHGLQHGVPANESIPRHLIRAQHALRNAVASLGFHQERRVSTPVMWVRVRRLQ